MARWENFHIWRGRLPHWRADNVTYFATFRHRREFDADERMVLFRNLLKPDGRKWTLVACLVLPEVSEVIFTMEDDVDLADVIEKAKIRAGKAIIKQTGERFPPFYQESYDRIIRDEAELDERLLAIIEAPVSHELAEDPDEYPTLYVANAPSDGS